MGGVCTSVIFLAPLTREQKEDGASGRRKRRRVEEGGDERLYFTNGTDQGVVEELTEMLCLSGVG